jgi:hypothetical protein
MTAKQLLKIQTEQKQLLIEYRHLQSNNAPNQFLEPIAVKIQTLQWVLDLLVKSDNEIEL